MVGRRKGDKEREGERERERRWELKPCRRSARRSDEPSGRRPFRRGAGHEGTSVARETRGWRRGVRRKAVRERDGLVVVGTRATKRVTHTRAGPARRGVRACVRGSTPRPCVRCSRMYACVRACVRACTRERRRRRRLGPPTRVS